MKMFLNCLTWLTVSFSILLAGTPSVLASEHQGFDFLAYLSANPDLPSSWGKEEGMNHYKLYGFLENRAVTFNLDEYLNANPDLPTNWTLADALNHYNMYGKFENRLLAFDAQEYLSLYSDLPQSWSYDQAYAHYVNYGSNEGRIASFDEYAYLELYLDLPRSWGQAEAFYHYTYYGQYEGRVYDPYDESAFISGLNVTAAGLWSGTMTDKTGTQYDVLAVISADGDIAVFSTTIGTLYTGSISVSGETAAGSFIGYAPEGIVFNNGLTRTTGTINLNILEKVSLSGTFTAEGSDFGSLSLSYDSAAEGTASLSAPLGLWLGEIPSNGYVSFIFYDNGSIIGSNLYGCGFLGQISVTSSDLNIYSVTTTITDCGISNGYYEGFIVLTEEQGEPVLYCAIHNSINNIAFIDILK